MRDKIKSHNPKLEDDVPSQLISIWKRLATLIIKSTEDSHMLFPFKVCPTRLSDSKIRDLANHIISEIVKRNMNVAGNYMQYFQSSDCKMCTSYWDLRQTESGIHCSLRETVSVPDPCRFYIDQSEHEENGWNAYSHMHVDVVLCRCRVTIFTCVIYLGENGAITALFPIPLNFLATYVELRRCQFGWCNWTLEVLNSPICYETHTWTEGNCSLLLLIADIKLWFIGKDETKP